VPFSRKPVYERLVILDTIDIIVPGFRHPDDIRGVDRRRQAENQHQSKRSQINHFFEHNSALSKKLRLKRPIIILTVATFYLYLPSTTSVELYNISFLGFGPHFAVSRKMGALLNALYRIWGALQKPNISG
jgi:hypothetical protein